MIPLADGLGTSADETAALFLVFFAIGLAIAGWVRLPRKDGVAPLVAHRVPALVMFAMSALVLAGAFTLPRYLRPRIAKIRPVTTAGIVLMEPLPDAIVRGRVLHVVVQITGGRIIPAATTRLRPDEGHLHVSIDGLLTGTSFSVTGDIDISSYAVGDHVLRVEFVAGDHAPFANRQVVERLFRIER